MKRHEYYGSPYDVGSYASHYDLTGNKPNDQWIGRAPEREGPEKGNYRGKGPRGYHRSDKRILEDVNDRLYLDPYINASGIEVQVDSSDVILTGTVENRDAKRLAEDIADSVSGVKNVENRLRVIKRLAGQG